MAETKKKKPTTCLIAAAPDLLEALKEHLRWYDGGQVNEAALIAKTRAAIAKATGEKR